MEILYLLVPMSLGIALLIGGIFWWAIWSRQFEDLDSPALAILLERSDEPGFRAHPREFDIPQTPLLHGGENQLNDK